MSAGAREVNYAVTDDSTSVYENSSNPAVTLGAEAEFRREWRDRWMLSGSYSHAKSKYLASDSLQDLLGIKQSATLRDVPNAPTHMASVRGAIPILSRQLTLMSRVSIEGPRFDRNDRVEDPAQGKSDPAVIWDRGGEETDEGKDANSDADPDAEQ